MGNQLNKINNSNVGKHKYKKKIPEKSSPDQNSIFRSSKSFKCTLCKYTHTQTNTLLTHLSPSINFFLNPTFKTQLYLNPKNENKVAHHPKIQSFFILERKNKNFTKINKLITWRASGFFSVLLPFPFHCLFLCLLIYICVCIVVMGWKESLGCFGEGGLSTPV